MRYPTDREEWLYVSAKRDFGAVLVLSTVAEGQVRSPLRAASAAADE
jgi:hypothetical protein